MSYISCSAESADHLPNLRRLVTNRWFVLAAMAVLIFLPIPFGNVVPAVALLLIGLGLVFEDGLALLAGATLGVLLVLGLAVLTVSGAQWLPQLWAAWQV